MCKRILIVDDETDLLNIMKKSLEFINYDVSIFTNPLEALEAFKENPNKFDLVITDLRMPEMQGDEFSDELLRIKPELPIFLFTGIKTIELKEKANFLRIKEVIEKPLSLSFIINKIKEYLI